MSKEELSLIHTIKDYILKETEGNVNVNIEDLKTTGHIETEYPCLIFGHEVENLASLDTKGIVFKLPPLKEMIEGGSNVKEYKQEVVNKIKELVKVLSEPEKVKEKIKLAVETKEKITVGSIGCDIIITETEASHLKKIKDILGGGKIVITKGELRIEIGE
jgi:hypothetical protein